MSANLASEAAVPREATRSRRLPVRRKLLYAAVVLLAVFGTVEGVFVLTGVATPGSGDDPYVGFAGYAPHFEPYRADGRHLFRTAESKRSWFNDQAFPASKGPRTVRIFCLGGSTTYGRPYDDRTAFGGWLRELLPKADPSREWEVVNAGGISYASYRVLRLMRELNRHEPDVFVVYTGHNEFLERRTYEHLLDTPQWTLDSSSLLSRTRTFTLLRDTLAPPPERPTLPTNVLAMLDSSFGPEDYHRDDCFRAGVREHFALALDRMVAVARDAGARIVFVTPACNVAELPPFKSEVSKELTVSERRSVLLAHRRGVAAEKAGDDTAALAAYESVAHLPHRHADLHFRLGRLLEGRGDRERAARELARALEEDVCPLRATDDLAAIVRGVAKREGVPLVDLRAELSAEAELSGLPGHEFFLDHVHPTVSVHRRLALDLVEVFRREGLLAREHELDTAEVAAVTGTVESRLDRRTRAKALKNLCKVLGWAGKLDESGRFAERSVALVDDELGTLFPAARSCRRRGDVEQAIALYRRMLEVEPALVEARVDLADTLFDAGRVDEAVRHYEQSLAEDPGCAEAIAGLGRVALRNGDTAECLRKLREALRLRPGPDLALEFGTELLAAGERREAIRQFETATEMRPDDPRAHFLLGNARLVEGASAAAAQEYETALEIDLLHAPSALNLAVAHELAGRHADAREALAVAVELEPRLAEWDASPKADSFPATLGGWSAFGESHALACEAAALTAAERTGPPNPTAERALSRGEP